MTVLWAKFSLHPQPQIVPALSIFPRFCTQTFSVFLFTVPGDGATHPTSAECEIEIYHWVMREANLPLGRLF